MNESSPGLIEAETPVNPYSLLEAVNRSSKSANAAWLIYIGLMSYLLITLAGVTHKDLLLNADIVLPILQVKINLTRFFLFAPIVLVLLHLGVVGQLVLLARKTLEFASSLRMLETTEQRTHPLRLELDNFFFVQAIAGPERSRILGALLHGMSWLTLVVMPVLLLLYLQLVFLPFHDVAITWLHRLALSADIALIAFFGVFLLRLETTFFRAFWRTGLHHPVGLLLTAVLLAGVSVFSLFIATVPGEPMDRSSPWSTERLAAASDGGYLRGNALPGPAPGGLLGFFHRNLDVTDLDLVVDKDVTPGEPSLNLRGRDLRFARLDRTDLHQADLTGADLEGASFAGADLRGAWMGCADLNAFLLGNDRGSAKCASARGASFARARLANARMAGLDLTGAGLGEAQLEGADLSHGSMAGANFAGARLDRADLTGGAALQGANFLLASLQGADLSGAKLQMADFASAAMQGANLSLAALEGAVLRDAELEGANLQMARLLGADMAGAKVQGSDMTGAVVWRTTPPTGESSAFSDMAQIVLRPPSDDELAALRTTINRMDGGALKTRLADALASLTDAGQNAAWSTAMDQQLWQGFARSSETAQADGYKGRITDYLARLMCRPRFANGAVATGIARRAMAQGFKGDMPAIYDRLRASDCPASAAMSQPAMRDLAAASDQARAQ